MRGVEGLWPPLLEATPENLRMLARRAYRKRRREWVPKFEPHGKRGIDSGRSGPAFRNERSVLVLVRRRP